MLIPFVIPVKDCWQQCDLSFERTADSWWYVSTKNRQKLRTKISNRKALKERLRGKNGESGNKIGEIGKMGGKKSDGEQGKDETKSNTMASKAAGRWSKIDALYTIITIL